MKINPDHRLYQDNDDPFQFVESPNFFKENDPQYLILHYTANDTPGPAIQVLSDPRPDNLDARVSAHLVIAPDGTITQLLPFDKGGWHAGESNWEGLHWLNHYSIGIEIVNDGKLKPGPEPQTWRGASGSVYQERDVHLDMHWKEFMKVGWAKYPKAQLDAVYSVSRALVARYGLKDILGHEDIHEGKVDPGPAFPIEAFRRDIYGREKSCLKTYKMKETAKVYKENPGKIRMPQEDAVSPLPERTKVNVKKTVGEWAEIRVQGKIDGKKNVEGWVKFEDLRAGAKKKATAVRKTPLYRFKPDPGPPLHGVNSLKEGVRVRVLREEGTFALVAILAQFSNYKFLQGWVPLSSIVLVDDSADCSSKLIDPDPRVVGWDQIKSDQTVKEVEIETPPDPTDTEVETQPPPDQKKIEGEIILLPDQTDNQLETEPPPDPNETKGETKLSPVKLVIHVEWNPTEK